MSGKIISIIEAETIKGSLAKRNSSSNIKTQSVLLDTSCDIMVSLEV